MKTRKEFNSKVMHNKSPLVRKFYGGARSVILQLYTVIKHASFGTNKRISVDRNPACGIAEFRFSMLLA